MVVVQPWKGAVTCESKKKAPTTHVLLCDLASDLVQIRLVLDLLLSGATVTSGETLSVVERDRPGRPVGGVKALCHLGMVLASEPVLRDVVVHRRGLCAVGLSDKGEGEGEAEEKVAERRHRENLDGVETGGNVGLVKSCESDDACVAVRSV